MLGVHVRKIWCLHYRIIRDFGCLHIEWTTNLIKSNQLTHNATKNINNSIGASQIDFAPTSNRRKLNKSSINSTINMKCKHWQQTLVWGHWNRCVTPYYCTSIINFNKILDSFVYSNAPTFVKGENLWLISEGNYYGCAF